MDRRGSRNERGTRDADEEGSDSQGPLEIAFVGDLTDNEGDLTDRILSIPPGAECTMFFDSPGGSPYCAVSLTTLILIRNVRATGIVTGECSSAALWPFAACIKRYVTPCSVLLFHPMKWQSEEHVGLSEATEWARHFGQLEMDMDQLLVSLFGGKQELLESWMRPGRYVTGRELSDAGLAEVVDLQQLIQRHRNNGKAPDKARGRAAGGSKSKSLS